jgi:hypothetical protein
MFTIAVYYFSAGLLNLTQVEILVVSRSSWLGGSSIALGRAPASPLEDTRRRAVPPPPSSCSSTCTSSSCSRSWHTRSSEPGETVRRRVIVGHLLGCFAAAFVLPLVAVASYFAAHGQLGRIWWAYVELSSGRN